MLAERFERKPSSEKALGFGIAPPSPGNGSGSGLSCGFDTLGLAFFRFGFLGIRRLTCHIRYSLVEGIIALANPRLSPLVTRGGSFRGKCWAFRPSSTFRQLTRSKSGRLRRKIVVAGRNQRFGSGREDVALLVFLDVVAAVSHHPRRQLGEFRPAALSAKLGRRPSVRKVPNKTLSPDRNLRLMHQLFLH